MRPISVAGMGKTILTIRFSAVLAVFLWFSGQPVLATENTAEMTAETHEEESFNFGETLLHHVKDSYEWHFFSTGSIRAAIDLPIMAWTPGEGLVFFSSAKLKGGHAYKGFVLHHGKLEREDGKWFLNLSLTKVVCSMLISLALLLWIFIGVARKYKNRESEAPHGFQAFIEPLVLFIRDEVVYPILGEKSDRYLPYLLTVFFFIWINNLLGLLPGSGNVTGNIAVTGTLAAFTFLIVNFSGNKHYWQHIFAPPGVPVYLYPIMWIVEIMGIFTKPFALMIRLFANILAGHMIILTVIGLIFIFGQLHPAVGWGMSVMSVPFAVFMMSLELLVAALQAYIFTILSALFIGQAIEESH